MVDKLGVKQPNLLLPVVSAVPVIAKHKQERTISRNQIAVLALAAVGTFSAAFIGKSVWNSNATNDISANTNTNTTLSGNSTTFIDPALLQGLSETSGITDPVASGSVETLADTQAQVPAVASKAAQDETPTAAANATPTETPAAAPAAPAAIQTAVQNADSVPAPKAGGILASLFPPKKETLTYGKGLEIVAPLMDGKPHGAGTLTLPNGGSGSVTFVDGKFTGPCDITLASKTTFKGSCLNGLQHGYGVETTAAGDVYEGYFENGKRNGVGTLRCADGSIFSGEWKDDLMHGKGTILSASKINYTGMFEGGMIADRGEDFIFWMKNEWKYPKPAPTEQLPVIGTDTAGATIDGIHWGNVKNLKWDDVTYTGPLVNGLPEGNGVLANAAGNSYSGGLKAGYQEGAGIENYPCGIEKYAGLHKNGARHGLGTYTTKKGLQLSGEWFHSFLNGPGALKQNGKEMSGKYYSPSYSTSTFFYENNATSPHSSYIVTPSHNFHKAVDYGSYGVAAKETALSVMNSAASVATYSFKATISATPTFAKAAFHQLPDSWQKNVRWARDGVVANAPTYEGTKNKVSDAWKNFNFKQTVAAWTPDSQTLAKWTPDSQTVAKWTPSSATVAAWTPGFLTASPDQTKANKAK